MKDKKEVAISQNIFFFNLREDIKAGDPILEQIAKLAHRYKNKAELIKDSLYQILYQSGAILGVQARHNLIPTTGRNVLARIIAGDFTYTGEINYGALGSGTTAFTNASTTLNTEVYRKLVSTTSFDDNIAYIDLFVEVGDVANQTFEEFGFFIDGTAAADSGPAWRMLITGGWLKSASIFISGQYMFI